MAAALAVVTAAEREVAELRQLKEEEESALLSALEAMAGLWQQLVDVRSRQGGLRLTDVGFSIMQLPQEETTPLQAVRRLMWLGGPVQNACGSTDLHTY